MNSSISYSTLFLFFTANLFCQDVLVKKDSSKIEVKLVEVRTNELKYKLFTYQEGPDFIISKSDVVYVIYPNGQKEVFKTKALPVDSFYYAVPIVWKGDTTKSTKCVAQKVGDYIKFTIQLGAMIQSQSSNYQRRESPPQNTASEKYSASSNKYVYSYNIGLNLLFGNSPYIKHIIGVNYLKSTGEYYYSSGSLGSGDGYGGYTTHSQDFHYVSKIDFINVVTGLRFKLFKKLYIEPLVAINIIAQSNVRYSGTSTTKYIAGDPMSTIYKTETEYFSNKKADAERSGINSTVSLCPKISYDFNVKKQTLGIYISYNLAYEFRLPWMMAGITYYPFKKLR